MPGLAAIAGRRDLACIPGRGGDRQTALGIVALATPHVSIWRVTMAAIYLPKALLGALCTLLY